MKPPLVFNTAKTIIAAAFAGLTLLSTEGKAVTVVESTDFGGGFATATDLTSTFENFLSDSTIFGTLAVGAGDTFDYFKVSIAPNDLAEINFSVSASLPDIWFGFEVLNSVGDFVAFTVVESMPDPGTTYYGTLSFMVPADGIVIFATSHETPSTTINYAIGTSVVPEPTLALLGAVGLVGAVLRRRRIRH